MKLPYKKGLQLTYCLNVHPAANQKQFEEAVFSRAPSVFSQFHQITGESGPYGVGLWLSGEMAKHYHQNHNALLLVDKLHRANLYCFTMNGFPYSEFHGMRVKEKVFLPNWTNIERLQHTIRLSDILCSLLPNDGFGSISTLPIGYRSHLNTGTIKIAVKHLMMAVIYLHHLFEETGKRIQLTIEPEPDCLLENASTLIWFYRQHLWKQGLEILEKQLGIQSHSALKIMKSHLGVCLDLIHTSVAFENPSQTLLQLNDVGIPIGKIQLGAALATRESRRGPTALWEFADDVYLHQTRILDDDGETHRFADLPIALKTAKKRGKWRIHYHVPLVWEGNQSLTSTRTDLDQLFFTNAMRDKNATHFEVETYTLGLFPHKEESEEQILAKELAWIYERMRQAAINY